MREDKFKEWLENKLKETPSAHYSPIGNSSRAVVSRGRWKEILYQYKEYPKSVVYEIKSFDGFNTPIIYFINLVIILLFSPIIPILWGYQSYKRAIEDYKHTFETERKKRCQK